MKINDALKIFEEYAPIKYSRAFVEACDGYDNVGVMAGVEEDITGILFSLDLTFKAVEKAVENGCNLIFTHHPAIYAPLKNIDENNPLFYAIQNKIGVISFHLNLDVAKRGIDYYMAKGLGALNSEILVKLDDEIGYGRLSNIKTATFREIVERYKTNFSSSRVLSYGCLDDKITKIASFCGQGISEEYINLSKDADLIVSADIPHHYLLKLTSLNKKILNVTHYSCEFYGFKNVYENLKESFNNVKIILNEEQVYL